MRNTIADDRFFVAQDTTYAHRGDNRQSKQNTQRRFYRRDKERQQDGYCRILFFHLCVPRTERTIK